MAVDSPGADYATAPETPGPKSYEPDRSPSWFWHLLLTVALMMYLWEESFPGASFISVALPIIATLLLGLSWLVWLALWSRRSNRRHAWRWTIAPTLVLVSMVLASEGVPLQVRFELGRADFNEIVVDLEPVGSIYEWVPLDVPDRVGTYDITGGYQVGENVILYEANGGSFVDDAGFAYLPEGPDRRLSTDDFEAPSFQSLGGGWYAWTAGW